MTLPLYYYVLGTPLGVLGLFRWACWLIRRVPAVLYRPIVNNYRLSMSIVVPVYQEDPVIFAAAIESWLRNRVHEVILVIDASDARCQEIASRYPVTVLITDVPGKRDALRKGWNAASTDLVALVDSDTIWADDVAAEVCKPFADPRIGGVGTRQSVYGTRASSPGSPTCSSTTATSTRTPARACSARRSRACPAARRSTGVRCSWTSRPSSCTSSSGACPACRVTTSGSPPSCSSAAT